MLQYFYNQDDPQLQTPQYNDEGDWWASNRCFASVACTAVIAATCLATQIAQALPTYDQNERPATAVIATDEDFWQNPVAPVAPSLRSEVFTDPAELPVHSHLDEDYWQHRLPVSIGRAPRKTGGGSTAAPQIEEEYWQNPTQPVSALLYQSFPYLPDPETNYPVPLAGPADEPYWQNPVYPVIGSLYQKLPYLPDPETDYPVLVPLPPIQDEDFSIISRYDLQEHFRIPAPWAFAGAADIVSNPATDEFFDPRIFVGTPPSLYQPLPYLPDPEEIPVGFLFVAAAPEEFYWQNPVFPTPPSLYQPLPIIGDPAEPFPPGTHPDEDFWVSGVAPVPPALYQPLPYFFDDAIPASPVVGQPDEDFWQNAVTPAVYQNIPFGFVEQSDFVPLVQPTIAEEDFWQNWVQPLPPSLYIALPLGDPEEIPAGVLYGQPDEDFWVSGVPPVPYSLYQSLPLGDPDELPAGFFFWSQEEEYWTNPAAPVPPSNYSNPLFIDPEELPPLSACEPDEDFWVSGVAPVVYAQFWMQPWFPLFEDHQVTQPPTASIVNDVIMGVFNPAGLDVVSEGIENQ